LAIYVLIGEVELTLSSKAGFTGVQETAYPTLPKKGKGGAKKLFLKDSLFPMDKRCMSQGLRAIPLPLEFRALV
jgi:hypothetical protein